MPDWTLQWITNSDLSISHSPLYSCERCPRERHEMLYLMAVERCPHNSGPPTHHIITEQDLGKLKTQVPKLIDDWIAARRLFATDWFLSRQTIYLVFDDQGLSPLGRLAEPLTDTCQRALTKLSDKLQALAEKIRNQNQRINDLLNKVSEMRRNFS